MILVAVVMFLGTECLRKNIQGLILELAVHSCCDSELLGPAINKSSCPPLRVPAASLPSQHCIESVLQINQHAIPAHNILSCCVSNSCSCKPNLGCFGAMGQRTWREAGPRAYLTKTFNFLQAPSSLKASAISSSTEPGLLCQESQ
jgi:hypothetical protein